LSAYIHGSLALDDRSGAAATTNAGRKTKAVTKKMYRAKVLPTPEKLLYLCAVIACCAVAGLIAFRYSLAFEMNSQLIKMETEIRQLEEENASLKNEVAKLEDPERLIDKGIQLGLAHPDDTPSAAGSPSGEAVALYTTE
jgi:cell division protein FtsL